VSNASAQPPRADATERLVLLTGNPNCGKTTLFNALTGLRAKVGNYPGVTVERKEGRLRGTLPDLHATVLDLPGTYSLSAQSLDEAIARDVLWQRREDVAAPDLVILVIDASNLERNLYFAIQVIELGHPTLVALNMVDVAKENGIDVDAPALGAALGTPVCPMVASTGSGVPELRDLVDRVLRLPHAASPSPLTLPLPPALREERDALVHALGEGAGAPIGVRRSEALLLLTDAGASESHDLGVPDPIRQHVRKARARLEQANVDWHSAAIEARYARAAELNRAVAGEQRPHSETLSDRIDRWVTHRVWGLVLFVLLMALMFQCIFTFAQAPMEFIETATTSLSSWVAQTVPEGKLNDLLVDGVIAGVGSVLVFLPQILLLFLFLGLLEDTGYMARGAFMMDRVMSRVGLHGKSFIPLLSSFACAIPGIMATRTIESQKDRLATILVAPLMSCSARLPVYALLIAACVPNRRVLGFVGLQGLTLLSMYLLGIVVALILAWVFKRSLLKGEPPLLILELPPYRRPVVRVVFRHMWDRSKLFLYRAGTVILAASIILWFLASYPRDPRIEERFDQLRANLNPTTAQTGESPSEEIQRSVSSQRMALDQAEASEHVRHSYAGRLGRLIEPTIAPLGFDWQIGIGIVASFAAREVFVSTMATIYNVSEENPDQDAPTLAEVLREQRHPDGSPIYTTRTALTLMVFYVFALQCVSTVAIVRRETNGWKWPLFQWAYMAILAWVFAFGTYRILPWFGVL
jgi:ferrous iron transport protein B